MFYINVQTNCICGSPFYLHSDGWALQTRLVKLRLLRPFSTRKSTNVSGARKDYLSCLRSPTKSTFKCLFKDILLWHGVMSMHLRNPEEQDDRNKGTLSNQPRLMCVTPTALLGSWVLKPIKDMTSLGTDFEMHMPTGKGMLRNPLWRNLQQGSPALSHQAKCEEPTGT